MKRGRPKKKVIDKKVIEKVKEIIKTVVEIPKIKEDIIETVDYNLVKEKIKEGYRVVEKRSPFGERRVPLYVLKK